MNQCKGCQRLMKNGECAALKPKPESRVLLPGGRRRRGMSGVIDVRKLPAYQKGYRDGFLEGQRIGLEIARKTIESRTTSYQLVQPRDGGPYSLFCYNCRRWIPNTANHEMQKEGVYAHGHACTKLDDGSVVVLMEDGIPEGGKEE